MSTPQVWKQIQRWMDGQVVRVNQSQLADALGVQRQTISQWKSGETRPSPDKLWRLHEVTRIPYSDLTDALLRDMGYGIREDVGNDGSAANTQAGESPASNVQVGPWADSADEESRPIAAHPVKGRESRGRQKRRQLDQVGEESQDPRE